MAQGDIGIYASQISGHLTTPVFQGDYWSLATTTLSSSTSSITFTGIPQNYTHLQIRALTRDDRSAANLYNVYNVQFNGDTGSNYSRHALYGQVTSAPSGVADYFGSTSTTSINVYANSTNITDTNVFGAQIVDIFDYSNSTKYKTLRSLGGVDENNQGLIAIMSGAWRNTVPITSITISGSNASLVAKSQFALYGVK